MRRAAYKKRIAESVARIDRDARTLATECTTAAELVERMRERYNVPLTLAYAAELIEAYGKGKD